ncbi:MAG: hypothetical protein JWM82_919 [Myxococcales bacterium]|nr:hypothetical protein [Myxococcales bacterium]
MAHHVQDQQVPANQFKALFEVKVQTPGPGFARLLENEAVLAAIPAVKTRLAEMTLPEDALSAELTFTLKPQPDGVTTVRYWYRFAAAPTKT